MPTLHATAGRLCRGYYQMNAVGLTNQSSPGNRDAIVLLRSKKAGCFLPGNSPLFSVLGQTNLTQQFLPT